MSHRDVKHIIHKHVLRYFLIRSIDFLEEVYKRLKRRIMLVLEMRGSVYLQTTLLVKSFLSMQEVAMDVKNPKLLLQAALRGFVRANLLMLRPRQMSR